jgi:hypothetical protein
VHRSSGNGIDHGAPAQARPPIRMRQLACEMTSEEDIKALERMEKKY